MARTPRTVRKVRFTSDDLAPIVDVMGQMGEVGDGWINVLPSADDDEAPTSLRFFTLFGGGGIGVTMCTWIPASADRLTHSQVSLGISHVTGRRAIGALRSAGVEVPDGWFVEQDHPRRGLVIRVPSELPHRTVLEWTLEAIAALDPSGTPRA